MIITENFYCTMEIVSIGGFLTFIHAVTNRNHLIVNRFIHALVRRNNGFDSFGKVNENFCRYLTVFTYVSKVTCGLIKVQCVIFVLTR